MNGGRTPIRIGDWEADPATNSLRRDGETVKVEPKAMDVLVRLAASAGQVVTREELFAAAWPGTVVGDEALSQSITKLRRALGDDPRAPTYIETIAKRGYRLAAAVGSPPVPPPSRGFHGKALFAIGLVMAVVLGLAIWRELAPAPSPKIGGTAKQETRSQEAYALFQRAQALFLARGPAQNLEARELYREAIERDPQYARAYAGLAMTHAMEHRLLRGPMAAASLERALVLAESARQIDPEIAEVHWALGFVHTQARRYPEAMRSLQRAIDLNPSFADAYALLGGIHTYVGQPAKSIPLLRTAMRIEPDAGYLYFLLLGRAYFFENDLEQALINLRAAAARNPVDLETHLYLAAALAASGNRAAAEWEALEIKSLEPAFALKPWLEGYPLASSAHRERLRRALEPLLPG